MNSTTRILHTFHYYAGLLWNDPRNCPDPTDLADSSCGGGAAAAAAVVRRLGAGGRAGEADLLVPGLDRFDRFVQMHPSGVAANRLILRDRLGRGAFVAPPYYYSTEGLEELFASDFRGVASNLPLSPTTPWNPFVDQVHFDEGSGATFMFLSDNPPALQEEEDVIECLRIGLDYVAKVNRENGCYDGNSIDSWLATDDGINKQDDGTRCWLPPVVFYDLWSDNSENRIQYQNVLKAGDEHEHPPLLMYGYTADDSMPITLTGKTASAKVKHDIRFVNHFRVEIRGVNGHWTVANVNATEVDIRNLPEEFKDEEYVADQTYLRELADEAIANDPVVGTSEFMPLSREGRISYCMGGECPIGNLFTEALRVESKANFAVMNSGGVRGPGWPAGEVHVSDIWAGLPFLNNVCTGIMSGVSVFRLLNHSTTIATFQSHRDYPGGDRLLQMSGMKMTYNTLVTNGTRLMSAHVWDEIAQDYLPLERLKLYKFASTSWMCAQFDIFPSLLGGDFQIEGEQPGSIDESKTVQESVANYLRGLNGPFDTSLRGSHLNDTENFEAMDFLETESLCPLDYFWMSNKLSCLPCPASKKVKFSDNLFSFLVTPDSRELGGRNILSNRELFNVTIAPKSAPKWVAFQNSTSHQIKGSTVIQPGENIAVDFDIDIPSLTKGTTRSTISFGMVIDGEYPGCLLDLDKTFDVSVEVRSKENLNQLVVVRPIGLTLMALAICLAVFFLAWTYRHRQHRVVRASQPPFMALICFGVITMASCIIPLSIDDSIASEQACSKACVAVPWLFSMGFSITFSALFAKIWRIHKVMSNAKKMKRVVVSERDALAPIIAVFTLNVALLLCLTLVDPPKWHREFINGDPTNSYGFCASDGKASIAFLALLILLDASALMLACFQAYRARDMEDEYTESRWLAVACASWIQVLVVGVPIILLTKNQPVASYFTRTALVVVVCVSMLLFMFVPKIMLMKMPETPPAPARFTSTTETSVVEKSLRKRIAVLEAQLKEKSRASARESTISISEEKEPETEDV